jgi:hypothetical protein
MFFCRCMCRPVVVVSIFLPLFLLPPLHSEPAAPDGKAAVPSKEAPRTDAQGDPLPYGAIMRIGTVRLRGRSAAFMPDGKSVVSLGSDNAVVFWEVKTGKEIRRLLGGSKTGYSTLALSPDGASLALTGDRGTVQVYDLATGKKLHAFTSPTDHYLEAVAFSPDGKTLFAGGDSQAPLRAWNLQTGKEAVRFDKEKISVLSLAVSPDGKNASRGRYHGPSMGPAVGHQHRKAALDSGRATGLDGLGRLFTRWQNASCRRLGASYLPL